MLSSCKPGCKIQLHVRKETQGSCQAGVTPTTRPQHTPSWQARAISRGWPPPTCAGVPAGRRCRMVTILARSPNLVGSAGSFGSLHKELSVSPAGGGSLAGGAGGGSQNLQQAMSNSQHHGPPRRATRNDIVEAFISNLRARGTIDLESPGILVGIREHFQHLPTRYALDVNIATLDVLNHKRCATPLL